MTLLNCFRVAVAAGAALLAITATSASASEFKLIRSFCRPTFCDDGRKPSGSMLRDSSGSLYGTTQAGGRTNSGVVYKLTENTDTHVWAAKVLYNFCNKTGCTDGGKPDDGRLVIDSSGQLYGVTTKGGSTGNGTVFTLTPNADKSFYTYNVIYNFCDKFSGCEDGAFPIGGLTYRSQASGQPYDGVSPLYGVTKQGGLTHAGVVFQLIPSDSGRWDMRILYVFCVLGGAACTDGKFPTESVSLDRSGVLWGTTVKGGNATDSGIAYKLVPTASGRWAQTVFHSFCQDKTCSDGKNPIFGTIIDANGVVYGLTSKGGATGETGCLKKGCGTFFKLAGGAFSVVHSFCSDENCADGGKPAGLMIDTVHNIFGTTNKGGLNARGTIFELNKDNVWTKLHDFDACNHKLCWNGGTSAGALVEHPDGRLFGTLIHGGRYEFPFGVAFQFTP